MLLQKSLGEVEVLEVDGVLKTELFLGSTDAGLRHLLKGILHMPNSIMNGKLPPMMPHHIFLEFHLSLRERLSGLLKLAQRHITLKTKGTPRLLKVMCLNIQITPLFIGYNKEEERRTLYHD